MKHVQTVSAKRPIPQRAAIFGKEFVCDQHTTYVKCHFVKAG